MTCSQLVWLRNDLRLEDNPALYEAQQQGSIHVVFIATIEQWRKHDESPAKLGLIAAVLNDLGTQLANLGIPFTVVETSSYSTISGLLADFCQRHNLTDLWFNQETPLNERRRDHTVTAELAQLGITTHPLPFDLIVASPVLSQTAEPYKMFTPYYRRWLTTLSETQRSPYPPPRTQAQPYTYIQHFPSWAGNFRDDLWSPETDSIANKLEQFCQHKITRYGVQRDYPARPATSMLSPYLSIGAIGPRQLVTKIQFHCHQQQREWLDDSWLRELAWRDFYRQLLLHFPHLCKGEPFKPETRHVHWRHSDDDFQAWCEGRTGFPIIDAAMRQLKQTGWMHNRLRMLAASFLCKLLLIDWHQGEQYFMQHLIDGEFAANNGGWQWSASTGCDAAPYFRIFNPIRQSEKFDPEGAFIRRFVPELREIETKYIHDPPSSLRQQYGYVLPILDYKAARQHAIDAFANLPD